MDSTADGSPPSPTQGPATEQPAKPKVCRYCGKDVTHKYRYKTKEGEYICRRCRRKHSPRPKLRLLLSGWPRRRRQVVLAIMLVILAALVTLFVLYRMHKGHPDRPFVPLDRVLRFGEEPGGGLGQRPG